MNLSNKEMIEKIKSVDWSALNFTAASLAITLCYLLYTDTSVTGIAAMFVFIVPSYFLRGKGLQFYIGGLFVFGMLSMALSMLIVQ